MWSIFRRPGPHHPDDHADVLGDQDVPNFNHLMNVMARVLEGRPLCRLVCLFSRRGRNSKGIVEKVFMSLFGHYHVPVKSTVFMADRRSENEHSSGELDRAGARVAF